MISDVIFASWQMQQGGMKSSDPALLSVHISLIVKLFLFFCSISLCWLNLKTTCVLPFKHFKPMNKAFRYKPSLR